MKQLIVKMRKKVTIFGWIVYKKKPQTHLAMKVLHCTVKWNDQFLMLRNEILELLFH